MCEKNLKLFCLDKKRFTIAKIMAGYPDISGATRVNLYKKLSTEDLILLDMMRGTATREKAEEVLRKKLRKISNV